MQWDEDFPSIDVEYEDDLPLSEDYWRRIKKGSLVVIDDLWGMASNSEQVSKAFKIYSKKIGFSIAIVTQVSIFMKKILCLSNFT